MTAGAQDNRAPRSPAASKGDTTTPAAKESDGAEARSRAEQRDRALVARMKQGDARAFREVVRIYQDRIYGLCYRMIGNAHEAEDLAQEVFLSVHRAIGSYRGDARFYTWLYRIASNTCKNRIKYLKRRHHNRRIEFEASSRAQAQGAEGTAIQGQIPGPEATVVGNRLEQALQRELEALDPDHRLLIVLRDVQGLSYEDILRITGLAEGTLKSRLHRARVALKQRLQPHLS